MAFFSHSYIRGASAVTGHSAIGTNNWGDGMAVTALANGGYAIAWQHTPAGGTSGIQVVSVAADGTVRAGGLRKASGLLTDPGGNQLSQWEPTITAAGNGFMVTWTATEYNGGYNTGRNVMGRLFDASGYETGTPFVAALKRYDDNSVATSSWERCSSLATLKDGRVVMAYERDGADISLKIFSSTGTEQSLIHVNQTTDGGQRYPKVAALKDGGFVVVWDDDSGLDSNYYGVIGRVFNANGTARSGDFVVNKATANNQSESEVTALAGGGFVVSWKTNYDAPAGIGRDHALMRVFNADGTARTGEFEVRADKNYAYGYDGVETVALADGGFLALYAVSKAKTGNIYGDYDCYVRRFNASGKAVGDELRVNPGDPDVNNGNQLELHGALLKDGKIALAWVDEATKRVVRRVMEVSTLDGQGTAGNDFITLTGSAGKVRKLGAGDDALVGSAGADTVYGGAGKDTITGGAGKDTLYGDAGDDKLAGDGGNDVIYGGTGSDMLVGGAGNDALRGGAGADKLYGEAGDDLLVGGAGGDLLAGGDGKDTASYEDATKAVTANLKAPSNNRGHAEGDSYKFVENLTGSNYDDHLTGDDKANTIQGGNGNDKLFGLGGNDSLSGGNGGDMLVGGKGADVLTGGAGADRFVFQALSDSTVAAAGRDTITDFSRQQKDRIDVSGIDAISATAKNDSFAFIGTAKFSKVAGELRFATSQGNTVVQGDVDGDGTADFAIQINGAIALIGTDFIL